MLVKPCPRIPPIGEIRTRLKESPISLLYVHYPFERDDQVNVQYQDLAQVVEEAMDQGITVVVADSHHSKRWELFSQEPARCRGDLAFLSNDSLSLIHI